MFMPGTFTGGSSGMSGSSAPAGPWAGSRRRGRRRRLTRRRLPPAVSWIPACSEQGRLLAEDVPSTSSNCPRRCGIASRRLPYGGSKFLYPGAQHRKDQCRLGFSPMGGSGSEGALESLCCFRVRALRLKGVRPAASHLVFLRASRTTCRKCGSWSRPRCSPSGARRRSPLRPRTS